MSRAFIKKVDEERDSVIDFLILAAYNYGSVIGKSFNLSTKAVGSVKSAT